VARDLGRHQERSRNFPDAENRGKHSQIWFCGQYAMLPRSAGQIADAPDIFFMQIVKERPRRRGAG
jgi:hypothetical protein